MRTYSIDPALVSLEEFRELTANKRMMPGRIALQEHMDKRFALLHQAGIKHLGDILRTLRSKSRIEAFSCQAGLSVDYLLLLKREAGSYLARPFPLSDFLGVPFEYLELLKSSGLKTTMEFFEKVQTKEQQEELSRESGIPEYRLKELFVLCDLSRITGVGGVFARILIEAGIRSPKDFIQMEAPELLERCRQVIEKYGYEAGKLGDRDIEYGISYAKVLVACDQKSDKK